MFCKHRTSASFCYLSNIDIFQYVTQCSIQGVSENMQQLLISTKIGCKPGRKKVIYQIQAYTGCFRKHATTYNFYLNYVLARINYSYMSNESL